MAKKQICKNENFKNKFSQDIQKLIQKYKIKHFMAAGIFDDNSAVMELYGHKDAIAFMNEEITKKINAYVVE